MSHRKAAEPDGGLPLYGAMLAFLVLMGACFWISYKYKNRQSVPDLAAASAQDNTNANPCAEPDFQARQYQDICAKQNPPLGGEDCSQFLYMAWSTSDESVSADFKSRDGCQ